MEVIINKENFEAEVTNSDIPVLVDFWATWCGPCQMLSPIVAEIAKDFAGKVKVCKVNVDDEPELANRFGISSIPTLILFKSGAPVAKSIGYKTKEQLVSFIGNN